jgi:hypothetical protein
MSETYRQRIKRTQNEALKHKARRDRHWVSEIVLPPTTELDGADFEALVLRLDQSVLAKAKKGQSVQPADVPTSLVNGDLLRAEILASGVRLIVGRVYDIVRNELTIRARADAYFAHV